MVLPGAQQGVWIADVFLAGLLRVAAGLGPCSLAAVACWKHIAIRLTAVLILIGLQGLTDPLVFKASLFGGLVETPGREPS